MPTILDRLEYALAYLLYNVRGHDSDLFTRTPPFSQIQPTVQVTSPECEDGLLKHRHTPFGEDAFPDLQWELPPSSSPTKPIKEWLVVGEDPDAPLPFAIVHGIFYGLPAQKATITHADLEPISASATGSSTSLKGGFNHGANIRGTVWGGARPPVGHGHHRYFFQVVGLSERVETELGQKLSKKELVRLIEGKIVAWGEFVARYERKYE